MSFGCSESDSNLGYNKKCTNLANFACSNTRGTRHFIICTVLRVYNVNKRVLPWIISNQADEGLCVLGKGKFKKKKSTFL